MDELEITLVLRYRVPENDLRDRSLVFNGGSALRHFAIIFPSSELWSEILCAFLDRQQGHLRIENLP
jgi:hypothetical protein